MGVPKFFRYTSERYPCLNELVKQYQIPDFDNMYLDMNGIIHNCSHPDDGNAHFRISEEKMFSDIFHYISVLFQIIKPKKLFFMAIDGVAPRAKMNQQRGRRFRSAKEAEKLEEEAIAKGEVLPTEKRFDSNCITPGTVFMARLHEQLKYFVKQKVSEDPLWQSVTVILTGHETPGEGEHKIMDYIRWARSQPDYDPNTRHCLYGLDADLVMLGMCSHEPHFALLREEVKFGKSTQKATTPEQTNFYLLHLSLLREYLEQEFIAIKDALPFPYDIEKIVDDWVLMGFLVGNDFIPNLPNMHINNDALPLLYRTYIKVLPTLDGYINEAGDLHLGRFEIFMEELAKIDKEKFLDEYADIKYFEAKTGRRPTANERREHKPNNDETFNVDVNEMKSNNYDMELQELINATNGMFKDDLNEVDSDAEYDVDSSDDEANFNMEFDLHKRDYYMNKLDYSKVTDEVLVSQAECYVRAIQWNLYYYYKGCPSWCWYYPHHYAPYISDIKGFKDMKIEFELGEPFKPFEQLLAVLPAASKGLLPAPFHTLMTDEDSPIVHYYPIHFETDLNGKRNDWEAVVLIPFIDETNLLSAMSPCYKRLTDEERRRNSHGPMLEYTRCAVSLGSVYAPEYFPPINECYASEKQTYRNEIDIPESELKRGMLPNAIRNLVYPGFPTMRHLSYTTYLKMCKVKVFESPSRNENMILKLQNDTEHVNLEDIGRELLGKEIWAGWPHLTRAKVISVSNEETRLHLLDRSEDSDVAEYTTEKNVGNIHRQWISERSVIHEHNMNRLGIELGDINIIVHAVNLKGYKYIMDKNVRMVLEAEWCSVPCGYALQAIVRDVSAHIIPSITKYTTPQEAYPNGDQVFLMTRGVYYGCMAKIVDSSVVGRSGRVKVVVQESLEPSATPAARSNVPPYRTAHHAAASCGISAQMLSRLTGTVLVVFGPRTTIQTESLPKVNIGLNLKFNKKNQEVAGYTRRSYQNAWLYSERCVQLVAQYSEMFPEVFDKLITTSGNDIFFESDLWPDAVGGGKLQEIAKWLSEQPHHKAARRECGSEALEAEELQELAASVDEQLQQLRQHDKTVTLQVKLGLLYKPELHQGNLIPDESADFQMYDRVVCVAKNITVPFGLKGTITGIYKPHAINTVRLSDKLNLDTTYQVMFDEEFPGALTVDLFESPRFYRMQLSHMLNISFGRKLRERERERDIALPSSREHVHVHTPNVLRRDDGHHSAFANYSPTKDRQTPSYDSRNINKSDDIRNDGSYSFQNRSNEIGNKTADENIASTRFTPRENKNEPLNQEEKSTELLKNLLKISSNTGSAKDATNSKEPQNWRIKEQQLQPQQPPPIRKANRAVSSYKKWGRENQLQKRPELPFPNFNQNNHIPRPNQIPFPQFQITKQYTNRNPFPGYTNPGMQNMGNLPHPNMPGNLPSQNMPLGNLPYQNQNQGMQNPRTTNLPNAGNLPSPGILPNMPHMNLPHPVNMQNQTNMQHPGNMPNQGNLPNPGITHQGNIPSQNNIPNLGLPHQGNIPNQNLPNPGLTHLGNMPSNLPNPGMSHPGNVPNQMLPNQFPLSPNQGVLHPGNANMGNFIGNMGNSNYPVNQQMGQLGTALKPNRIFGQNGCQGFPKHLPNVSNLPPTQAPQVTTKTVTSNPKYGAFVPLQVQARQAQGSHPPPIKKEISNTASANTSTDIVVEPVPNNPAKAANKPKRIHNNNKKKSRLAANLPFQN